jgi:DNA-directed RNA polymerase subunit RPC12/RpoP
MQTTLYKCDRCGKAATKGNQLAGPKDWALCLYGRSTNMNFCSECWKQMMGLAGVAMPAEEE